MEGPVEGSEEGVEGSEEGVEGSEEGVEGSEEGVEGSEEGVEGSEEGVEGSEEGVEGSEEGSGSMGYTVADVVGSGPGSVGVGGGASGWMGSVTIPPSAKLARHSDSTSASAKIKDKLFFIGNSSGILLPPKRQGDAQGIITTYYI